MVKLLPAAKGLRGQDVQTVAVAQIDRAGYRDRAVLTAAGALHLQLQHRSGPAIQRLLLIRAIDRYARAGADIDDAAVEQQAGDGERCGIAGGAMVSRPVLSRPSL